MSTMSDSRAVLGEATNDLAALRITELVSSPPSAVPFDGLSRRTFYHCSKRLIDLAASVALLILAAPVMLAIAAAIRMTSPGPVIFRQRRPGLGGELFWCYKFRTMVIDAEARLETNQTLRVAFEQNFKLKHDPRLTGFGKFLRKSSLDELPQLINILEGSMSLIGPRPILTSQIESYLKHGDKIFSVKPGLGGYWQVYGRSNTSHEERVRLDSTYVEQCSLMLDLKLIVLTAVTVIKGHGAY